mmetsp:Transcript_30021/g.68160  ORF Transcript_30021/g.68160 Transcript_30021/m.68160 type:complete len:222 (-) Transcript_30021:18-683(-)
MTRACMRCRRRTRAATRAGALPCQDLPEASRSEVPVLLLPARLPCAAAPPGLVLLLLLIHHVRCGPAGSLPLPPPLLLLLVHGCVLLLVLLRQRRGTLRTEIRGLSPLGQADHRVIRVRHAGARALDLRGAGIVDLDESLAALGDISLRLMLGGVLQACPQRGTRLCWAGGPLLAVAGVHRVNGPQAGEEAAEHGERPHHRGWAGETTGRRLRRKLGQKRS